MSRRSAEGKVESSKDFEWRYVPDQEGRHVAHVERILVERLSTITKEWIFGRGTYTD